MAKKQIKNKAIAIFKGQKIRRLWDEEKELWYFSVIDIIAALNFGSLLNINSVLIAMD